MNSLRNACLFMGLLTCSVSAQTPSDTTSTTVPALHVERQDAMKRKIEQYGGRQWDIVFDGDSITNRWETTGKLTWQEHFAGRAADFGIEGDRTEHVLWRLQQGQLEGVDPKVVVLMIGTNNSGRNSVKEIANGIRAIVTAYEQACPHAHIILMSVFPRGELPTDGVRHKISDVNKQIQSLAKDSRITLVDIGPKLLQPDQTISRDMMPDFVHPTASGYEIWADSISPLIDQFAPLQR